MKEQLHSAEFIGEMKQLLEKEKKALLKQLGRYSHEDHGDLQAVPLEYGRDEEENAMEMADFVTRHATTEVEEERLKNVESALERIATGTYGVTDEGEVIPAERLRANPAATTTVSK